MPISFNPGDRVVCINDKASNKRLVVGDQYIVTKSTYTMKANYIYIVRASDQLDMALWYAERFEKIKQFTINNNTKTI